MHGRRGAPRCLRSELLQQQVRFVCESDACSAARARSGDPRICADDAAKWVVDPSARQDVLRRDTCRQVRGACPTRRESAGTTRDSCVQIEMVRFAWLDETTVPKAVSFYLNAAKYVDLPLSPLFKVPPAPPSGPRKPRAAPKNRPAPSKSTPAETDATPASTASQADAQAKTFRDLVLEIAKKRMLEGDELDAGFSSVRSSRSSREHRPIRQPTASSRRRLKFPGGRPARRKALP